MFAHLRPTADGGNPPDYRAFPVIGSRVAAWVMAQLHLFFAAFVLGVPIFAVITEFVAWKSKDEKYDKLSHEFTRLLVFAYSATALWGAMLHFALTTLYPKFWAHMAKIFSVSMWIYVSLFFVESFTLYVYYYGWERFRTGRAKWFHWSLGVLLNVWGTTVMLIANGWLTYMMSPPKGVTAEGLPPGVTMWNAIANATWIPINIHRLIANAVFGGSIVAAYAAYRFLAARTDDERAHYDWMGYVGNFIAISTFIVLPFAGYWLGREIYQYNQQMGITMMGGFMSWLWIVQAVLIGVLLLSANYYLWIGTGRIPGAERFVPYTKWMLLLLIVCWIAWSTPHTMIATRSELAAMGGAHHPFLNVLGVMSAKNTAVNLMILTTFLSFLIYRRANKEPVVPWARTGTPASPSIRATSGSASCSPAVMHCSSAMAMGALRCMEISGWHGLLDHRDLHADGHAVPGVDLCDCPAQLDDFLVTELILQCVEVGIAAAVVLDQPGHGLGPVQRGAFALAVQAGFAPGLQAVDALPGLAMLAQIARMHVQAEGAAIELRHARLHEIHQDRAERRLGCGRADAGHGLIGLGSDVGPGETGLVHGSPLSQGWDTQTQDV